VRVEYPAVRLFKAGTVKTKSTLPGLKKQNDTGISATAAVGLDDGAEHV
jgi:hypothetical protein